jgi:hypothetical protein
MLWNVASHTGLISCWRKKNQKKAISFQPHQIATLFGQVRYDGRGQKPRQSFIWNRYRCSGRVADWLGSLGYSSFLKDS